MGTVTTLDTEQYIIKGEDGTGEDSILVSSNPKPVAMWADEIASDQLPISWLNSNILSTSQTTPTASNTPSLPPILRSPALLPAKTVDSSLHKSTNSSVKIKEKSDYNTITTPHTSDIGNETRQLEAVAFPVGVALGTIGALLWPTIFNNTRRTTTTSTTVNPLATTLIQDDWVTAGGTASTTSSSTFATTATTTTTTTTTTSPATTTDEVVVRTVLEDFSFCGEKGSTTRVVGGKEVVENEYPWLCSLKYKGFHICGISLLSGPPLETILVGAAHCFSVGDTPSNYKVTCGEHSLRGDDDYEVTLTVTQVIIHHKYIEASSSGYDIAVYKVDDSPLKGKMKRKKIWPACLPEIDDPYDSVKSYVAGWGITKTKNVQGNRVQVKGIPDIARHTSVTTTACEDADNFDYPSGLICAAEIGRDSCQGDSGGPLISESLKYSTVADKRYSWIGIVSFGVGCAEVGYPGAYTRASCFLGFIAEQFSLRADFSAAGGHQDWSTDCPTGASSRYSAQHRNRYRGNGRSKIRRKINHKNSGRRNTIPVETSFESANEPQINSTGQVDSEDSGSRFVTKDQLITIYSYEDESDIQEVNNKKQTILQKLDKEIRNQMRKRKKWQKMKGLAEKVNS